LLKDDPKHAQNRRLSIVLLRGTGQQNFEEVELDADGNPIIDKPKSLDEEKKEEEEGDTIGGIRLPPNRQ